MSVQLSSSAAISPQPAAFACPRLEYLYGARGLAALWVVSTHFMLSWGVRSVNPLVQAYRHLTLDGTLAIALFITMSGFLLVMPAALNGDRLPGGAGAFVRRRALRLLPPYLFAYLGYLALYPLVGWLARHLEFTPTPHFTRELATYYTPAVVLSHLLVVFNLREEWVASATGIFWTIPVEWHLYLAFAFVLYPACRRLGWGRTLLLVMLGSAMLHAAHVKQWLFYHLPWYAPVFMFGACAAHITFSTSGRANTLRALPWGWISLLLTLGAALIVGWILREVPVSYALPLIYGVAPGLRWIPDLVTAIALSSLMIWLTRASLDNQYASGPARGLLWFLSQPWLTMIGRRSYSLYLTHGAVIICLQHWIRPRQTLWIGDHLQILGLGLLLCAAATWLFHAGVERHFLPANERMPHRDAEPTRAASMPRVIVD
jgi:peptidoglycan/LPS O-acetylase OafA/YrhL